MFVRYRRSLLDFCKKFDSIQNLHSSIEPPLTYQNVIYNISIISSKVYKDDFYESTRTKLILDKISIFKDSLIY